MAGFIEKLELVFQTLRNLVFGAYHNLPPKLILFYGTTDKPRGPARLNRFHPLKTSTRPSPNTMRIFLKSVAMRSCEQM